MSEILTIIVQCVEIFIAQGKCNVCTEFGTDGFGRRLLDTFWDAFYICIGTLWIDVENQLGPSNKSRRINSRIV